MDPEYTGNIQNVATTALLNDAVSRAHSDEEFKADLQRYFIGHLPFCKRIIAGASLSIMGALMPNRPVPWFNTEILNELRRRQQEK